MSEASIKYELYAGVYKIGDGTSLIVKASSSGVKLVFSDGKSLELSESAKNEFKSGDGSAHIKFSLNGKGLSQALSLRTREREILAERVFSPLDDSKVVKHRFYGWVAVVLTIAAVTIWLVTKPEMMKDAAKSLGDSDKILDVDCSNGNGDSCFKIGVWRFDSITKAESSDLAKKATAGARKYFEAGCKVSHLQSCFRLGRMELDAYNSSRATELFTESCKRKHVKSCYELGQLSMKAGAVDKALLHYGKACELGEGLGCLELAEKERKEKNYDLARELYKKSCSENIGNSCYRLKNMGEFIEAETACNDGDYKACYSLGDLESREGNTAKARKLHQQVCSKHPDYGPCKNLRRGR